MPLQHQTGTHPVFEFPLVRSSLSSISLYIGKFHSRRGNHLKMHFLFGSAAWPPSQLLNASLEGENESSSESYTLFQFFSGLFRFVFFGNEFVYSCISPKDNAITACSQSCHDIFIHFIVSGATGVPWKTEAGFLWTCFSPRVWICPEPGAGAAHVHSAALTQARSVLIRVVLSAQCRS